jgi:hypothetical protein
MNVINYPQNESFPYKKYIYSIKSLQSCSIVVINVFPLDWIQQIETNPNPMIFMVKIHGISGFNFPVIT